MPDPESPEEPTPATPPRVDRTADSSRRLLWRILVLLLLWRVVFFCLQYRGDTLLLGNDDYTQYISSIHFLETGSMRTDEAWLALGSTGIDPA